jgi:hypothetical protein
MWLPKHYTEATLMPKKRGRPRLRAEDRKGKPVNIRFNPGLRALLEEACRRSGARSLSAEIEQRLSDSLTVQQQIEARFGGPTTAAFLTIIADGIMEIQAAADGEHWLDNRFIFEQVRTMLDAMLNHRRPSGRADVLPENIRKWHPLLKADAKDIGRKTALRRLALLDAAGNAREVPPSFLAPTQHYMDKSLARGLRGSPRAELEKLEQGSRTKTERYWKSRSTSGDARRRKVDALIARSRTSEEAEQEPNQKWERPDEPGS